jgi:chromatin segregation and condensation protein Rec8/ScpA/Scc1 (kleisin family)
LKGKEKPYYLRQPWDILFKEAKLEKVSPWSIDLVLLLSSLIQEMEKTGIDFRLAGTAINSSVLIFLKKAEMLLKMEVPKTQEEKLDTYIPPAIPLPFRFEHTTTTVNDLIEALEKALTERSKTQIPKLPTLPLPVPDFLDIEEYLLEIERRSEELFERLNQRYQNTGDISITEIIYGLDWLEVVRVFMMLLFLAQQLQIDLQQPEDEVDIIISVTGN